MRFYGERLRRSRVILLPLHGVMHLSVAAVEFLARAKRPVTLLCDNVRASAIAAAEIPSELLLRAEEDQLRNVLMPPHGLTVEGPVRAVAFDEPDILTALPERAVDSVLRECVAARFEGWRAFRRARIRQDPKQNVKGFFVDRYGLGEWATPSTLVPMVVEAASPENQPMPSLARAIEHILA